jgi:DnaJ-class molecular chaperone
MICEKCWSKAAELSFASGKPQTECYIELIQKGEHKEPENKICPKCQGYGEIEIKEYSVKQDMIRSNGYDPGEPEADGIETCPDCKGEGVI